MVAINLNNIKTRQKAKPNQTKIRKNYTNYKREIPTSTKIGKLLRITASLGRQPTDIIQRRYLPKQIVEVLYLFSFIQFPLEIASFPVQNILSKYLLPPFNRTIKYISHCENAMHLLPIKIK